MKILQTKITLPKNINQYFYISKKLCTLRFGTIIKKEITFRKNVNKSNLQKKMQKEVNSAATCRPEINQCSPILRILQKL